MNYTAISIGPIYKTLAEAKKSRELWGASYLFSYISRTLIEKINNKSNSLILPFYPDLPNEIDGLGAGFFADRIIYEGDVKNKIEDIKNDVFGKLSTESGINSKGQRNLPEEYLKNYIRITVITFTLPVELEATKKEKNIVSVANKLLDSAELQEKYYQDITDIDWRTAIDNLNREIFYKKAFKSPSNFLFPSLLEIATDDFRKINESKYQLLTKEILNSKSENLKDQNEQDNENQKNFILALKKDEEFKSLTFRPYHEYVAVVEADGDNIGETIRVIGEDTDQIQSFSEALFNFSKEATRKISDYGGKPVYSGGDDLLFFAPIASMVDNNRNITPTLKSIFGLLEEIDDVFARNIVENEKLKDLYKKDDDGNAKVKEPSLSFGISVSHNRFPLNESRDTAHCLLRKAKEGNKNKICFELRKHSGQSFRVTIDKSKSESYRLFLNLMSTIPLDKELLTSLIFKLRISHLLLNQIANDKKRLYIFFNQEFNVDLDSPTDGKDSFIKDTVDYYYQLAMDFPKDNVPLPEKETKADTSNIGKLFSTLRFMKHLIDESDE
ncbi:type III-B CRISPR-associated protein Cas10/Cmr2 [Anaerorudis cellulosivorans]|uniref:type III-B CRISPR-associated protein Cas10/Cmr2 n=1 Tax=Anaerorudis cellulosivorans TaxID=3397862 RepID=UPI00222068DD|nr:type III-B CRISPR-associated protein Cas10/Cmr2 [Seramator thermalis]MCW1735724.1 type III-B CRISPR-associated protein Cas10/Cmr2 [Seramator thermalis]